MDPEGSQQHASCPYPESDESSPHLPTLFLIISSHFRLGLLSGILPTVFRTKILNAFLIPHMHATCSAPTLRKLLVNIK